MFDILLVVLVFLRALNVILELPDILLPPTGLACSCECFKSRTLFAWTEMFFKSIPICVDGAVNWTGTRSTEAALVCALSSRRLESSLKMPANQDRIICYVKTQSIQEKELSNLLQENFMHFSACPSLPSLLAKLPCELLNSPVCQKPTKTE